MPQYSITEKHFAAALSSLEKDKYHVKCTIPRHELKDNHTMYRGWEITEAERARVIMWDEYPLDRDPTDENLLVSVGTPNGSKGCTLLKKVQQTLLDHGAADLMQSLNS